MKKINIKENRVKIIIYLFIFLILILIISSFFSINKEITIDSKYSNKTLYTQNKKINSLIDYKYLYLTKLGLKEFNDTKVTDYNNNFITNLIYNNKIFDKDDSLAQEVVYFYILNKTNLSTELTKIFFTQFLQKFDADEKIQWRDQVIIFIDPYENKKVTLFNKSSLLITYNKSTYKGEYETSVSLYNKIAYYLYFKNGTVEIYNISLTDKDALLNIKNKIFPNNKFNTKLKDVKKKYYYSKKKYYLLFKIWKS